ncbi:MAG: hypothetical protein Kow0037_06930 [Calditrichia bacterium]
MKIQFNKILMIVLLLGITAMPVFSQTAQSVKAENSEHNVSAKNVLMSLVLPGSGEWLAGHTGKAKFFLGVDATLWAGLFGIQKYLDVLKNDYMAYAAVHAGVNTSGKSDQYWIDVGNADDLATFNQKRLLARDLDGIYPEKDFYNWVWDSRDNRYRYNDMRFKHHDWKRRSSLLVGALILNRIVSAVDVIRLIRKNKKSDNTQYSQLFFNYNNRGWNRGTMELKLQMRW